MATAESTDKGLSWNIIEGEEIKPIENDPNSWKRSYVYGFDTLVDPENDKNLWVFYNARNGWKKAQETVGVSRILTWP